MIQYGKNQLAFENTFETKCGYVENKANIPRFGLEVLIFALACAGFRAVTFRRLFFGPCRHQSSKLQKHHVSNVLAVLCVCVCSKPLQKT